MVLEHQDEYLSQWKAIESIAEKLSVNHESLRQWVRRAETDAGQRPGLTTDERARLNELERENRNLRRANDPQGSVGFFRGGARPPVASIVALIDAHRDAFGVEPICRVLCEHGCQVAPNTYYCHKKRPPSARSVRDEYLRGEIARVWAENMDGVYGADKVWTQLNREGIRVARCSVEPLLRQMGMSGARRGKAFKVTTRHDDRQHRPSDLVDRKFAAPAPNRLWVADLTYVKTHAGWVYAAFVIDVYSRMVVGWQISNSLRCDLAIDALEMAIWNRTRTGQVLDGLIHHSDRGGNTSASATPSASPRTTSSPRSGVREIRTTPWQRRSSLYKWELIYRQGPWRGLDDVEFTTLGYIDWFNHRRLHGEITADNSYATPAEFEALYYRQPLAA
jgi:putative transposase